MTYKFQLLAKRSKAFAFVLAVTVFILIANISVFWTPPYFNDIERYGHYHAATIPSKIDDQFVRKIELSTLVVNPHGYRIVNSLEDKCKGEDVFLVVVVTSAPGHVKQRDAIRQTWGNENILPHKNVKVLFALGRSDNPQVENAVQREVRTFQDIIQEEFLDSYRNLTIKTVMVLKWTVTFCSGADYLMKTDDDMFVNIETLVSHLKSLKDDKSSDLFIGDIHTGVKALRSPANKHYVSMEDYENDVYPDYLSGTGYVMSMDVVRRLYVTALMTSPVPVEDIYMGICARRAGIAPRDHRGCIPPLWGSGIFRSTQFAVFEAVYTFMDNPFGKYELPMTGGLQVSEDKRANHGSSQVSIRDMSTWQRIKFNMKERGGFWGLYRGLGPGTARSFLANGTSMIVMVNAQKKVSEWGLRG
uniref:Hexosyltransferase n=1 Tax=Branchiostoma floridae TaxID=7739 RepID=C3YQK9_BRAFL|eukprot:XP_002601353.1 hypothetical protein BRAFLDRAFT_82723 [Branchiostoma floridae]